MCRGEPDRKICSFFGVLRIIDRDENMMKGSHMMYSTLRGWRPYEEVAKAAK